LRTGWLVRPGDPRALAGALNESLSLDLAAYRALALRAGNSRNSCFRRKTLPLRSSISMGLCCPGNGNGLHRPAIRPKTRSPLAAHVSGLCAAIRAW
jgi:hypothetical protein